MTEVITEDSAMESSEPSEALDEGLVDFGADLDGDTQDEAAADERGHSEETTSAQAPTTETNEQFDVDNVDWLRVDVDTIPEQYRPLQALARNMQAGLTREQQALAQVREQASSERSQYLQALQSLQQANQQNQQPEQTPYEQVAQHLDEDERRGLEVVQTLNQQAMAPILEQVAQLQAQLQEAQQGSNAFQAYLQQQQVQARTAEVAETRAAYGAEVDALTQQQMGAMKALVDQGASVKGAFESVTGKTSEQIVAARARDKEVRNTAKHTAASTASRASTGGAMASTDAEVRSGLEALGFDS